MPQACLKPDSSKPTKKENQMPTLRVELFAGRTPEQKAQLAKELTEACVRVLSGEPAGVDIVFYDIERYNWATAGKLWIEPKSATVEKS